MRKVIKYAKSLLAQSQHSDLRFSQQLFVRCNAMEYNLKCHITSVFRVGGKPSKKLAGSRW
jgi:hypothetical protein